MAKTRFMSIQLLKCSVLHDCLQCESHAAASEYLMKVG
jgi:hypothetical protein